MQNKLNNKTIPILIIFLFIIGAIFVIFSLLSPSKNNDNSYIDSISKEEVIIYTGDNSTFFITGINQISSGLINSSEITEILNQYFSIIYKEQQISYKYNSLTIDGDNYSFILQSKNETYNISGISSGNSYTITITNRNKDIFNYKN